MRGTKTEVRRGVWRLRVVINYDPKTGVARQKSRTVRGTKKQADDALAAFVTEVRTGTTVTSTDTLNALLDRWLEHAQGDLSPTTLRGYRDKLVRVRRDLGDIKLTELTAQRLDRAYNQWRKEGLSPQTVRHIHRVLPTALHQAEKWDLVARAATDKATPPKHVDMPVRAPSPEVVLGLIEEAKKERVRDVYLTDDYDTRPSCSIRPSRRAWPTRCPRSVPWDKPCGGGGLRSSTTISRVPATGRPKAKTSAPSRSSEPVGGSRTSVTTACVCSSTPAASSGLHKLQRRSSAELVPQ